MSQFSTKRIGSVLENVIDDLGAREKIDEARVIEVWAHLAGRPVNRVTESAWMKNNVLHLKIRSSAWRQELRMGCEQWRERLNEELGEALVHEIRLH